MAKKDFNRRERKKPKKDEGKATTLGPISITPPVEVLPKGKSAKEPRE